MIITILYTKSVCIYYIVAARFNHFIPPQAILKYLSSNSSCSILSEYKGLHGEKK